MSEDVEDPGVRTQTLNKEKVDTYMYVGQIVCLYVAGDVSGVPNHPVTDICLGEMWSRLRKHSFLTPRLIVGKTR